MTVSAILDGHVIINSEQVESFSVGNIEWSEPPSLQLQLSRGCIGWCISHHDAGMLWVLGAGCWDAGDFEVRTPTGTGPTDPSFMTHYDRPTPDLSAL